MSIAALQDWKDSFAAIPLVSDQTWKNNLADWIDGNVTDMKLAGYSPAANISFTYSKATFASSLPDSGALGSPAAFLNAIASAFQSSINSSTLSITPPMASPAFTAISGALVDAPSVASGMAAINATILTNVEAAEDSAIIPTIRNAFLGLTYTVSGTIGGNPTSLPAQGVL